MDKWLLMFFLGAILSLFLPIVPALFYIVLLLTAVLLLMLSKKLIYVTGFLLGCAWILFNGFNYQHSLQNNKLEKSNLHQSTHIITGEILTLQTNSKIDQPQETKINVVSEIYSTFPNQQRFNIKVTHFDYIKLSQPFVVRLSWQLPNLNVKQGYKIRLKVKLKPAHGFANSGGFNYQIWLAYKNIVATGYVLNDEQNKLIESKKSFRQQQFDRLKKLIPKHPLSSLISALALGERGEVSLTQWQILKATGTQHLIAISGLHLGLVASSLFIFILFILKIVPLTLLKSTALTRQLTQVNGKYFAIFISLTITCYYAALSGFAIPTMRALLMLSLYWLSRMVGIKLSLKRWLLLVVFFVLLSTPMSILSASFWLSFYAVGIIFLLLWRCFYKNIETKNTKFSKILVFIKSLVILQLGLSILLLPITLLFYHQLSLVTFFANILAVPWMSFTAIPLSLCAMIIAPINEQLALWFLNRCLSSLDVIWQWLSFLAQQSWALQDIAKQPILLVSLLIIALAYGFFMQIKWRYYCYFMPLLLAVFLNRFWLDSTFWQVTVLDVGHGLAVVIERDNHVIVYDTGAKYPSGFNLADVAILPFLQQKGINEIDKVIISHNDNDHLGGLAVLMKKIPIRTLIYNKELDGDVGQQHCLQGQRFIWQELTFEQLWPTAVVGDNNDDSCIIRVSDGHFSVLFTGDASKKVEKILIKNKLDISANVLIASHHGSKSASSESFLKTVNPQYAVFSSGYLNRWHMPVDQVLLRYHRQGIKTYTTANVGMVQINVSSNNIRLSTYRDDYFPYWFAN